MTVDYSLVEGLSDTTRTRLQQLCSSEGVSPWVPIGRTDVFWFVSVLLQEKPACWIGIARPSSTDSAQCPITEIAEDAGLSVLSNSDESNGYLRRHLFISEDPETARAVHGAKSSTSQNHQELGDALGYPEDAVAAFPTTSEADVLQFIRDETEIPPEEARYVYSCPYLPAPTDDSVRRAIDSGKRYATIAQQLHTDRPEFVDLPAAMCPLPIPAERWDAYVSSVVSQENP